MNKPQSVVTLAAMIEVIREPTIARAMDLLDELRKTDDEQWERVAAGMLTMHGDATTISWVQKVNAQRKKQRKELFTE